MTQPYDRVGIAEDNSVLSSEDNSVLSSEDNSVLHSKDNSVLYLDIAQEIE